MKNELQKLNLEVTKFQSRWLSGLDRDEPINLVLSGGGVKGVGHIALIEKLEEMGFTIGAIAGSSAGALVGTLYALGMPSKDILEFFKTTPLFRISYITPTKPGIFDTAKYGEVIKQYVPLAFEDLKIPMIIAATNAQKGRIEYFSTGRLREPLLASCAVPALFTPIEINGELYTDGGVMDNFPVFPFLQTDVSVIGSYVCKPATKEQKQLNSILKMTNHANSLLLYAANQHKFPMINQTVVFPLGAFNTFDTKQIDDIYITAKAFLNKRKPK